MVKPKTPQESLANSCQVQVYRQLKPSAQGNNVVLQELLSKRDEHIQPPAGKHLAHWNTLYMKPTVGLEGTRKKGIAFSFHRIKALITKPARTI